MNGEARSLPDVFMNLVKAAFASALPGWVGSEGQLGIPPRMLWVKRICSSASPAHLEIRSQLLKIMRFRINKCRGISACFLTAVVLGRIYTHVLDFSATPVVWDLFFNFNVIAEIFADLGLLKDASSVWRLLWIKIIQAGSMGFREKRWGKHALSWWWLALTQRLETLLCLLTLEARKESLVSSE